MSEHRRLSGKTIHIWQKTLYSRIRATGGWDSVVVHEIPTESAEAARKLEAELIKEHFDDEDCLNSKRELSDQPDAIRMRSWYELNREKWNAYNRVKQAERRAKIRASKSE